MFKSKSKLANLLAATMVVLILVPVLSIAGPFSSDAELVVYPNSDSLVFSSVPVGAVSSQSFVIENKSNFVKEIEIVGRPSAPFAYESSSRFELLPYSSRNLVVSFAPTSANGTYNDTLKVRSLYTGETKTLNISGRSINPVSDSGETISHTKFIFPKTVIGQVATGKIFITNKADISKKVVISSDLRVPFELFSPKEFTLGAREVEEIVFNFIPTSERKATSSLQFLIGNTRYNVTVEGEGTNLDFENTGLKEPFLVIAGNPNGFVFNAPDTERELTLTNAGDKDLELEISDSPKVPFRAYFRSRGNTERTLRPGSSTVLRVSFTPSRTGVYESSFVLKTNSVNIPSKTFYVSANTGKEITIRPIDPVYPPFNQNETSLTIVKPEFNPDLGESTFFNFNLAKKSDIEISIVSTKSGLVVHKKKYENVSAGKTLLKYSWDGRNSKDDKVSSGKYEYFITVSQSTGLKKFNGILQVLRAKNYFAEPVRISTPISSNCGYGRYCSLVNKYEDNSLINKLRVNESEVTKFGTTLYVSFESSLDSKVTVNVLDSMHRLVKPLTTNRPMRDGFNNNLISWDTKSMGQYVPNGVYYIELTADANGVKDTDKLPFKINRKPLTKKQNYNVVPKQALVELELCDQFVDVDATNVDLCKAVIEIVDAGILTGDLKLVKTFRPDDYITRAEATSIVVRLLGLEVEDYNESIDGNFGFKDLDTNSWFAPYVKSVLKTAVAENGPFGSWSRTLVFGYQDGTIRADQSMTRAEFYKLFLEAINNSDTLESNFKLNSKFSKVIFPDFEMSKRTAWFMPYADFVRRYLSDSDFAAKYFNSFDLNDKTAKFNPYKGITRGEVAELYYEMKNRNLIK